MKSVKTRSWSGISATPWKFPAPQRRSDRGAIAVYLALGMMFFMGVAALSVDMGHLYTSKARAQRAADSAALAGAYQLANRADWYANTAARNYAATNGYDATKTGTTIVTTPNWKGHPNWYNVSVSRQEPLFFARIFGRSTQLVNASATAQYLVKVVIPIDPLYYGLKNGPVTYSVFGPDGLRSNGDKYSPKLLSDKRTTNPYYDGKGYDFSISIPDNYYALNQTNLVQIELFDPDCYNKGNNPNVGADRVDEYRPANGSSGSTAADATTTQYSIIWDKDGNPNNPDPSSHQIIAHKSFGNDAYSDMQWNTPPGFTFAGADRSLYPTGTFRLNVTTIKGSSKNGFNLRAGPPHVVDSNGNARISEQVWHDTMSGATGTSKAGRVNGTSIGAVGNLPMNFNMDGVAQILLGYVPATAAGGKFLVSNFDADVGAKSVYFICDTLPGRTFPGTLSGNDREVTDHIALPSNYNGGTWYAMYNAGAADQSVWSLTYDRGQGAPGGIKLVE
jgi:Flp pilus assembly protein TadG